MAFDKYPMTTMVPEIQSYLVFAWVLVGDSTSLKKLNLGAVKQVAWYFL